MTKYELAIVIPAYKIDFFDRMLESLKNQTCKDFNVYIGIDASKSDFETIVANYTKTLNIICKRFSENLGGKNLVAQWTRCIELTQNEPWIWLFSDDDMIEKNCVEQFYKTLSNENGHFDIYHYNVKVINDQNKIIKSPRLYPNIISSFDFYRKKQSAKLDSFVVEYIFSRKIYNEVNGFELFDLAWGADIATWCKMGMKKGIKTINNAYVYWRKSNYNITPQLENSIAYRKINIEVLYYDWMNRFFKSNIIKRDNIYFFVRSYVYYSLSLKHSQQKEIIYKAQSKNIVPVIVGKMLIIMTPIIKTIKYIKMFCKNELYNLK